MFVTLNCDSCLVLPYCSKYVQLPMLRTTTAHTRQTQGGRRVGTHQRQPFYDPNRRFESWHLGHLDKIETWDRACSYSTDNISLKSSNKGWSRITSQSGSIPYLVGDPFWKAITLKTREIHFKYGHQFLKLLFGKVNGEACRVLC